MNNVLKSIGWANWTINPVRGLCPVGCPYCYARRAYSRNCNEVFRDKSIRFAPEVFRDLSRAKSGDIIFVGSTIDLFHPLCSKWNGDIFNVCSHYPDLIFIFLTKCPENLPKEFPSNCWVGVSVTNTTQFIEAHRYLLPPINSRVRIISFEPLLNPITYPVVAKSRPYGYPLCVPLGECCDWVIIGAQSPFSQKTAPSIRWVKEIVESADKIGIPVFLKNNLVPLFDENKDGKFLYPEWAMNKNNFALRQEFPKEKK